MWRHALNAWSNGNPNVGLPLGMATGPLLAAFFSVEMAKLFVIVGLTVMALMSVLAIWLSLFRLMFHHALSWKRGALVMSLNFIALLLALVLAVALVAIPADKPILLAATGAACLASGCGALYAWHLVEAACWAQQQIAPGIDRSNITA